jgi:YcxB-like protein
MNIKSKLTEKDFIEANFILLYSKKSIIIFTGVFIIFLIISLITFIFIPSVPFTQVVTLIVLLIAFPTMTYFAAKKNYVSNQRVSETIDYKFEKDNLLMTGESFNSQLTWDKVYKVTQTKNWIFIWQNKQFANLIPKKDVKEGKIEELKNILNEHKVKNNL